MAKQIRKIEASQKIRRLVDQGSDVNAKLKDKTFEDTGIKKMLTDAVKKQFADGEKSLEIEGTHAVATISRTEKMEVRGGAEVLRIRDAALEGHYGDAVEVERVLNVPVDDRERAAEILQAAGIPATVSVDVSINPDEYRIMVASESASQDGAEARSLLDGVVESSVSYRVKYKGKKND